MEDSASSAPSLLEPIPSSELEPQQIVRTDDGDQLLTHKFLRLPSSMDELEPYYSIQGTFIWMENGTLVVLTDASPRFVVQFEKSFSFSPRRFVKIYGDSDDAIVETAVFFGKLQHTEDPVSNDHLYILFSEDLTVNKARSEQLALVMDHHRTKKIWFSGSTLNRTLSTVLATRPYPIHLVLQDCLIDFDDFMEHLRGRSTSFGSLSLKDAAMDNDVGFVDRYDVGDIRRFFDHCNLLDHLGLPPIPSNVLLQLLTAPMKSIAFAIDENTGVMDLSKTHIVAKHIEIDVQVVQWSTASPTSLMFPENFLLTFLPRIAQLGHLKTLKISWGKYEEPPIHVTKALIHAVVANKHLKTLELTSYLSSWDNCLKDLFEALETHKGLRSLHITRYPSSDDPHFLWIKQLLNRNRQIEILRHNPSSWPFRPEVKRICVINRCFRGSLRLTIESPMTRRSLVSAALIHSAPCDLQRMGIVLADHTDAVCELLQDVVFAEESEAITIDTTEEDRDTKSALVERVERGKEGTRKRKADTS